MNNNSNNNKSGIVITCSSSLEMLPSGGTAKNSCTSGDPSAAYFLPSSVRTHVSLLMSYARHSK